MVKISGSLYLKPLVLLKKANKVSLANIENREIKMYFLIHFIHLKPKPIFFLKY